MLAYDIDFPEEDDGRLPHERVAKACAEAVAQLDTLLATVPAAILEREGATVVLAGPPNAGKSSLLNALVGEARVIVSEVPGTTRDAVEVLLEHEPWPLRLVDTAGLRERADPVESLGIKMGERYLARAHVVVACAESVRALMDTAAAIAVWTQARRELAAFSEAWKTRTLPVPVAATHVRAASAALDELIGAVDMEDVFARVFSTFCVGKQLGRPRGGVGERGDLSSVGTKRPREAFHGDSLLDHPRAEEIARALGDDVALHRARFIAHPAREVSESKTQPRTIEIVGDGTCEDGFELSDARVLLACVTEVLPGRVSGTEMARRLHGKPLVHEMLAECCSAPCLPVRVVSAGLTDKLPHLASALRRRVAHAMRNLVRKPHRDQLGVESEAARGGIGDAGKMLEAHKGDAAAADHHLACVRGADPDHENDVDVAVHLEEKAALFLGRARECDDVRAIKHRAQIGAFGGHRVTRDFLEVRARGLDDVVMPVRFQQLAM